MADFDQLLARAEAELAAESGPSGMHYGDSTKRELFMALRVALERPTWDHLHNEVALAREDGWSQRAMGDSSAAPTTPEKDTDV